MIIWFNGRIVCYSVISSIFINFEYAIKAGFILFSSCMCNIEFETAHAQFTDSFPNRGTYLSNIISTNYMCMKFIFRDVFLAVRLLSLSHSLSLSLSLAYSLTFIFYAKMYMIKSNKTQISLITKYNFIKYIKDISLGWRSLLNSFSHSNKSLYIFDMKYNK